MKANIGHNSPPPDGYMDISSAPKDGTEIECLYRLPGGGFEEGGIIMWSDNPICMLGRRAGSFPEGWAVGYSEATDTNLPVDAPDFWREITNQVKS